MIIIDPEITLGIEITATQVDKETTLNHRMEIKFNIQIRTIKTTEVLHQNIKDKLIKCSQQKTLNQTLPVLKMQKTQNYS